MRYRVIGAVVIAVGCAAASGCGPGGGTRAGAEAPGSAPDARATVTIRGTVRFNGVRVPEPTLIVNTTDPQACGHMQRAEDVLVDDESRGIANVIVSVRGVAAAAIPAPQPGHLVLANRDCQFVPHVAVLTVGSTIEAVNHDGVLHTAHLYGALERNLALPDASMTMTVTVTAPGMISVLCDVHGWMKAFIRVDAHPFHAITDTSGGFVIEEVPVGDYDLDVWHERLGARSVPIHVRVGAPPALEIELGSSDLH